VVWNSVKNHQKCSASLCFIYSSIAHHAFHLQLFKGLFLKNAQVKVYL